jgi:ATP-binding cassette, subfamily B, bacterial
MPGGESSDDVREVRLSLIRLRWTLLRELMRSGPGWSAALVVAVVAPPILAGASIVLTGRIIDAVPEAVRGGLDSAAGRRLTAFVIAIGVVYAVQMTFTPIRATLGEMLGRQVEGRLRARVMGAVLDPPGVAHLDRPDVQDRITLAQAVGLGEVLPRAAVVAAVQKYSNQLQGLVSASLLFAFAWWAPFLLVGAWLLLRRAFIQKMRGALELTALNTRSLRRSSYFRDLALDSPAAKETRVFALDRWLVDRFVGEWTRTMSGVWRLRRQGGPLLWGSIAALTAAHVLILWLIGRGALAGTITPGAMVVYLVAIPGIGDLADSESDSKLDKGSRPMLATVELEREMRTSEYQLPGTRPVEDRPRRAIRFEGVRFQYPGQQNEVFSGLDLEIPVGRSLAIVGANGAGKTTLVKLLARLYDPVEGRITVDGTDLREFDPRAWSRRVSAIFQDFVRYALPVRDNVGFGALSNSHDTAALRDAVRRAGASEVVDSLPKEWDTVLSPEFAAGVDLSGGQWQRIAFARALFAVDAGAGVLVLDEPTAQLDARAEADFYDRFLELTEGRTTIVISHRFSTVRRADHIVVLDRGRVVEQGVHDDLVAAGGQYAKMFTLQAARFADQTELAGTRDA